ncbi:hypothetical protein [Nocardia amamiensis]|uniref:hypothetical protein n=1 Tax=Nocardia amamiensis TaxID=404578 RepID=UPI000831A6F3|nr:hypothetical protein [Nocardia amamiensis]
MELDDTQVLPPVQADTASTRCRFYREACGLPARVQPEIGSIVVPAGRVGAITMPHQLGAGVKSRMHSQGVKLGPIVSHPRSKRWTFLIVPDVPDESRLFSELFRLNVYVTRVGAQIALPSPVARGTGFRTWVTLPRDKFRPSGIAVVESIHACAVSASYRKASVHV